jgi:tetratricopeptide (TPR) repeat protein
LIICGLLLILATRLLAQDRGPVHVSDPANIKGDPILPDILSPTVWPPPLPPRTAGQPAVPSSRMTSVSELRVPSAAKKELRRFERNWQSANLEESVTHLERAIQIYPQLPSAHQNLGVCYFRLRKYDQAEAEFETAAKLDPQGLRPLINLTALFLLEVRYVEAQAAARHALELDGGNPAAQYLLGRILAAQGHDSEETLALLRESRAQYSAAHLILADILLKRGAVEEAVAELRAYLQRQDAAQNDKDRVKCMVEKLTQDRDASACAGK